MKNSFVVLIGLLVAACGGTPPPEQVSTTEDAVHVETGRHLFKKETFEGNGRTCATCHGPDTGTVSPEQAQARFDADPTDPLFRSLDSDDGVGASYTRLLANATVRIPIALPANVVMEDDPTATTVVLNRGIPTTNNVGLQQDFLMYDGREAVGLAHQAVSAVHTHYQTMVVPTDDQATAIADFQSEHLFSSAKIRKFSEDGTVPELPKGSTAAEKRGRLFFVGDHKRGLCAQCHDGPMLNTTNSFNPVAPPGGRFATNFSAELNEAGNPVHTFAFTVPGNPFAVDGVLRVHAPDAGRALITGDPCAADPSVCFTSPTPGFANVDFRIPTLWGVSQTAPYFHDSSAKNFDELMVHYQAFFAITAAGLGDPDFNISDAEASDIKAFLTLL